MTLEEKVAAATALVHDRMRASKNPVLCLSFGKDSMVMLDLILRAGYELPVVYWKREHRFPQKNHFANEMIEKFDLEVYDYPPEYTKMLRKDGQIEVVNFFAIGKHTIEVPTEIAPYKEGEKYLCGLLDMYMKPRGHFEFPWDAMFIGHKSADVDPLRGAVPLLVDEYKHNEDCPVFCFPLRHFTDDDIWAYTEKFGIPQNTLRYSGDELYNNDRYPACTACINPDNPETVFCPKAKMTIANVSKNIVWTEELRPAYVGSR
jgi:3'-phosphoadenosine 5'-phosphosulfate sulfotransferase (PAPS reductase)/FAD synthetase